MLTLPLGRDRNGSFPRIADANLPVGLRPKIGHLNPSHFPRSSAASWAPGRLPLDGYARSSVGLDPLLLESEAQQRLDGTYALLERRCADPRTFGVHLLRHAACERK